MKRIAIVGAGGFAREVQWLVREINAVTPSYEFAGYLVSSIATLGPHDSLDEVIGELDSLESNEQAIDCLAIGIGTPGTRLALGQQLRQRFPHIAWPSLVHPSARIDRDSATIRDGAIVCAGVIATVNVTIEALAMVNLACTIGHESVVGEGSVLNPSVNVSGGVTIGKGVLVGTGAQILQYLTVGDASVIGAGAVVTRDVASGDTVVGIPARRR